MNETIGQLTEDRVDWLAEQFTSLVSSKPDGYFQSCLAAQKCGGMIVLIARTGESLHGYLKIVWKPDYAPLRDEGIPEIQDLNVAPASRRQGIATRLMDAAERIVAEHSSVIGIGVGLHPGYAAAQRMYVLRGYVPDAMPLTYSNKSVTAGQAVKLDDELILHMTKNLGAMDG
jgi:GNAT superfamily N-acetyltransferase